MPLSELQVEILRLLAANRSEDSYVAGSMPLNRQGPRFSEDIDIFHARAERVAAAALADLAVLAERGFVTHWLRQEPALYAAVIRRHDASTRLEWVVDSDFRFFPLVSDELFGFTLHVVDLAANKALAAGGRREPRDLLDLLFIHQNHLKLGAVAWAAAGKDPGFSPESLIAEIRRNARYRADDYADLALSEPIDVAFVAKQLRAALDDAEAFVRSMPAGKEGLLFLDAGRAVQPDPRNLDAYGEHAGRLRGHWPSTSEIGSAMLHFKPGTSTRKLPCS